MHGKRHLGTAAAAALLLVLVSGLGSVASVPVALSQAPGSAPLGTAFTYQGYLREGGRPVDGACDLRFGLWDAESDGSRVGPLQELPAVPLHDGLFTVQLDFGAGAFPGQARWLEVAVRCAGDAGYTTLFPRQLLAPAPQALHAANAGLLDGRQAGTFAAADHGHGGASWSGTPRALNLLGGFMGLEAHGSAVGIYAAASLAGQAVGVEGEATASSGVNSGVVGRTPSTEGTGVSGVATAGTGPTRGVHGLSNSDEGTGVLGEATAAGGATLGVHGLSNSDQGTGVLGEATASTGFTYGVYGVNRSGLGAALRGWALSSSGEADGLEAGTFSPSGAGVRGLALATTGTTCGVLGKSYADNGRGVVGEAAALGGTTVGVLGKASTGMSWGVAGWNAANGAGIGAWSLQGDLIQAYDGDFLGGDLRFKVDQAGNVHLDGSLIYFGEVGTAAGGGPGRVALYGPAGTEPWIEDLGSGRLVAGRAEVPIDPVFAQMVAPAEPYQVHLTATCQEPVLLFVSEKAPAHFVVQGVTLDGQPSGCGFDYRLVARRLGAAGQRLEPVEVPPAVPAGEEGQP